MPEIIIKSKVRKIFKDKQVSEEALELLDKILYAKLTEINSNKAYLIKGRITEDEMLQLLKGWLD